MSKYLLSIFVALLVLPGVVSAAVVSYSTPGTYSFTVPAGVTSITVKVWGAGAGGSNGIAIAGQAYGGGGGGYGEESLMVIPGTVYTILVGSGGLGGDGNGFSQPTSGSTSIFQTTSGGILVSATGGVAHYSMWQVPSGGTSGATFNISGGAGLIGTPTAACAALYAGTGFGGYSGGMCAAGGANGGNGGNGGAGGIGARYDGVSTDGSFPGGGAGGGGVSGESLTGFRASGAGGQVVVSWIVPAVGTVNVSSNISSSWTITGPATITGSGATQSSPSQPVGTYTLTWDALPDYITPISQSFTLTSGGTITFNGTYAASAAVPTIASPTVTSITTTGATLGANVTSPGLPATISSRGTCFGTTPAPITNCAPEGGATTGVFTQARTGMTAGTTYYYRGYAVNTTGTGYSPDGSFTTTASVNGTCGTSNLSTFSVAPSLNLCSAGTATAVVGTGPWFWSCNGSGGGTNASCQAFTNVVAGSCGSANGTVRTTAPILNLCSYTATAPTVTGTGPWNWTCSGANGGANASCAAGKVSCGDGICSVSESPVSCAKDCKVKYRTF